MTTPIPLAAIDATSPTSRSTFRLVAGCVGATNRGSDTLRRALLAQWAERASVHQLEQRLQSVDHSDPDGTQGVEARLAVWFGHADPGDHRLVAEDDPVLNGLSNELRNRLAGIAPNRTGLTEGDDQIGDRSPARDGSLHSGHAC